MIKGLVKAAIVSLAIATVWYRLEWRQFGELQWGRKCDDAGEYLGRKTLGLGDRV